MSFALRNNVNSVFRLDQLFLWSFVFTLSFALFLALASTLPLIDGGHFFFIIPNKWGKLRYFIHLEFRWQKMEIIMCTYYWNESECWEKGWGIERCGEIGFCKYAFKGRGQCMWVNENKLNTCKSCIPQTISSSPPFIPFSNTMWPLLPFLC